MAGSSKGSSKRIGDYQYNIQSDLVGKGGFGVVFKGQSLRSFQSVAIKKVKRKKSENRREIDAIQREISVLKLLRHDNIVNYIDHMKTTNHHYIIMEYIENGSLSDSIKKYGPMPENQAAYYVYQLLTGLAFLHSQGVIHCDIKGANVLLTSTGLVKLADFGLATKLADVKEGEVKGTPYWMAPEIASGEGPISESVDIWSVGCTVIELITGTPPYFDLNQHSALYHMVNDDHPPFPKNGSSLLESFLIACFQKTPSLRTSSKSLLEHAWLKKHTRDKKPQQRKAPSVRPLAEGDNDTSNSLAPSSMNTSSSSSLASSPASNKRPNENEQSTKQNKNNKAQDDADQFAQFKENTEDENYDDIFPSFSSGSLTGGSSNNDNDNNDNNNNNDEDDDEDEKSNTVLKLNKPKLNFNLNKNNNQNKQNNNNNNDKNNKSNNNNMGDWIEDDQDEEEDWDKMFEMETAKPAATTSKPKKLKKFNLGNLEAKLEMIKEQNWDNTADTSVPDIADFDDSEFEKVSPRDKGPSKALMLFRELDNTSSKLEKLEELSQVIKEDPQSCQQCINEHLKLANILNYTRSDQHLVCAALKVLRMMIKDPTVLESLLYIGVFPLILPYLEHKHANFVRVEASYFLAELVNQLKHKDKNRNATATQALQMFTGNGGLSYIGKMIDHLESHFSHLEIVVGNSIDVLVHIFDMPKSLISNVTICEVLANQRYLQNLAKTLYHYALEKTRVKESAKNRRPAPEYKEAFMLSKPPKAPTKQSMNPVRSVTNAASSFSTKREFTISHCDEYIEKISALFLTFSKVDSNLVKDNVSQFSVINKLVKSIDHIKPSHKIRILKTFTAIAFVSQALDILQKSSTIPLLVKLLKESGALSLELHHHALHCLHILCHSDWPRQLSAMRAGVVPRLKSIIRQSWRDKEQDKRVRDAHVKQYALPLICDMTKKCSHFEYLWKENGVEFYLEIFEKDDVFKPNALDSLANWLQAETPRVEEALKGSVIDRISALCRRMSPAKFHELLGNLERFMYLSNRVAERFGQNQDFMAVTSQELRDGNNANRTHVLRHLLRIFQFICEQQPSAADFVDDHGLREPIEQLSSQGPLLVSGIASDFLKSLRQGSRNSMGYSTETESVVPSSAAEDNYTNMNNSRTDNNDESNALDDIEIIDL